MNTQSLPRRGFLKVLATILCGIAVKVGTKKASAAKKIGTSDHNWGMVIDQSKCIGCGYCVLTCQARNDISPKISWIRILNDNNTATQEVFLPVQCMHCASAPCVSVCPVGASYYHADGTVMMDYDKCIGCRYCQIACPYGARSFNWEAFTQANPSVPIWGEPEIERRQRGVVEKCTLCHQRIERGLNQGLVPGKDQEATPACVNTCPVEARIFGDLNDPDSEISKKVSGGMAIRLRADLGTSPRIYYIPGKTES